MPDFVFKEVFFVEEENDGGVDEPLVVADALKELGRLCHAVHFLVLGQDQVVPGQRHAEDDGRHSFETVNPLLPL